MSAANRVNTATSCGVIPSTSDSPTPLGPERNSGTQVPDPVKDLDAGSFPLASTSLAGLSLDSFATYSVPSSRIVMLLATAAGSLPGWIFLLDTNLYMYSNAWSSPLLATTVP